jgi:hypothetical protein
MLPDRFSGGTYEQTKGVKSLDVQGHHILSWNGGKLWNEWGITKDELPSIQMTPEDHRRTLTCGGNDSSLKGKARNEQQDLVNSGRVGEAWMMDVNHIRDVFGNKYDRAIVEAEAQLLTLEQERKIDLEHSFREQLLQRQNIERALQQKELELEKERQQKEHAERESREKEIEQNRLELKEVTERVQAREREIKDIENQREQNFKEQKEQAEKEKLEAQQRGLEREKQLESLRQAYNSYHEQKDTSQSLSDAHSSVNSVSNTQSGSVNQDTLDDRQKQLESLRQDYDRYQTQQQEMAKSISDSNTFDHSH